jgi:hypothetical protein
MGSLSFALGGAASGLGQGIEKVAMEELLEMRDQKILDLQNQYASQRQQAGFAEGEKMHGIEHGEAVQAATAQRAFQEDQQKRLIEAQHANVETSASARRYAADQSAGARRYAADASAKAREEYYRRAQVAKPRWQTRTLQPEADPSNPLVTPKPVSALFNAYTGKWYANDRAGNLVQVDNHGKPLYGPDNRSRASASEVQDLLTDPLGVVPVGPNKGIPKSVVFERAYHYLPAGFSDVEDAERTRQGQSLGPPPGSPVYEPATTEEGGSIEADAAVTGQSVNGVPYSPSPTMPSQPSDDQPAR